MRTPLFVVAFGLLATAGSTGAAPAVLPRFQADVLHHSLEAHSFAMTADEYVWAAGRYMVQRWDGVRWDSPTDQWPGLVANTLRVVVGPEGTVWMARSDPTSARPTVAMAWFERGRFGRVHAADAVMNGPLTAMVAHGDGRGVWLAGPEGLYSFVPGSAAHRLSFTHTPRALVRAADGTLIVGSDVGWHELRDGHFVDHAVEGGARALAAGLAGDLLVAGPGGVTRWDAGRAVRTFSRTDGLPEGDVRALASLRNGAFWVGTDNGLAYVHPDGRVETCEGLLPDDRVLALAVDRDGLTWVGTEEGGIAVIREVDLWNLGVREGLPNQRVTAVATDGQDLLWAVTPRGLVRWRRGELTVYRRGRELPDAEPRALALLPGGGIVVTTTRESLLAVSAPRPGEAPGVSEIPVPGSAPTTLARAPDGLLWMGAAGGGAMAVELPTGGAGVSAARIFRRLGAREGLCRGEIVASAAALDGTLWLGSASGGVTRVRGDAVRCFTRADGLTRDEIGALTTDTTGTLWVGFAASGGIGRIRRDEVARVTEDDGLFCGTIHHIAALRGSDGVERLWMGCRAGIGYVPTAEVESFLSGTAARVSGWGFDEKQGMRARSASTGGQPGIGALADGTVWFATPVGLTTVRSAAAVAPPPARPPFVETVVIDGQELTADSAAEVTAALAQVSFRYAAPSSRFGPRMLFRHRLLDVDKQWFDGASDRTARYGLGPGRYRFEVQSSLHQDAWTSSATFDLTVRPPLHRRPTVIAAAIAAVAALALWLHRFRMRQQALAEALVQEERARMARDLHDGLTQGLSAAGYLLRAVEQRLDGSASDARTILRNATSVLEHSYESARTLIRELRDVEPPRALAEALTAVVERHKAQLVAGGPTMTLALAPAIDTPTISVSLRRDLPMAVSEALWNAVRHAQASTIEVIAERDRAGLRLTVRDDGRGMATASSETLAAQGHFGLVGLAERVRRLGGELTITPREGGGTVILISVGGDALGDAS